MDCLKDFQGNDYNAHTKCISEAQKYSGKDFVQKESRNKGAEKQEAWLNSVRTVIESKANLDDHVRSIFDKISQQDNVPRKKAKFLNFLKNCMRVGPNKHEFIWKIMEEAIEHFNSQNPSKVNGATEINGNLKLTNGTETSDMQSNGETIKQSGKRKATEEPSVVKNAKTMKNNLEDQVPTNGSTDEFDWNAIITKLVTKKGDLSIEKLKLKVLRKYCSHSGESEISNKLEKKFKKHLKRCENVNVSDDIVKLKIN